MLSFVQFRPLYYHFFHWSFFQFSTKINEGGTELDKRALGVIPMTHFKNKNRVLSILEILNVKTSSNPLCPKRFQKIPTHFLCLKVTKNLEN